MSKKKKTQTINSIGIDNNQQKIANMENSYQVSGGNINQSHNTKKQSLGPNTKR